MSDPVPAYCPFYCEENVWHLCAHPAVAGADTERRVLIISNRARRVAMWGQRAAKDPSLPLAWDYHVVLLVRATGRGWEVWDLDAIDPGPRAALAWLEDSFDRVGLLPERYAPRFRVVSCADYRRHLRSDRRHMRLPDGSPRQPPPPWPELRGEPVPGAPDDGSNLHRFIDTEDSRFLGELFDLAGLRRWLVRQSGGEARA